MLEVGAREVNGSVRPICERRARRYLGVDIEAGKGVDVVVDAGQLIDHFGVASFDVVISTEMVEHVLCWPDVFYEMMSVLRPDGLLILTTRSIGFEIHDYPGDHWRYSKKDMTRIFQLVGEILLLSDDMTYGYPCGVGVAVRRKAETAELVVWKEYLRKACVLYNVTVADRVTFEQVLTKTCERDGASIVNRWKLLFELPFHAEEPIRWLDLGGRLNDQADDAWQQGIALDAVIDPSQSPEGESSKSGKDARSWVDLLSAADESYDVVSFLDLIHQLNTPEALLKEIRRVLKPEGVFILSTIDPRFGEEELITSGHVRPPSFWVRTLEKLGFDVCLRFGDQPDELELLAVRGKQDQTLSIKRAFQALRSEFAKDIFIEGETIHLVPRTSDCTHTFVRKTLFYALNPSKTPFSITFALHTKEERHPDLFLNDLKLHYTGFEQDGASYLHYWKTISLPPGGHDLTLVVADNSLEISYLHAATHKKNTDEFLLQLSFDHYQRYRFVSQILHSFAKKYLSVLDVGGARGYLQLFASQYDVATLDITYEDLPKTLQYDGTDIPFADHAYDVVVAVDTLEHIPQADRQHFIDELCRVAGDAVILCGPLNEPNVADAETVLKNFIEVQLGKSDRFLDEHFLYTLPDRAAVRGILARNGFSVSEVPNGFLPRWLSMQLADFTLNLCPEQAEGKARFNALYNAHYYEHDNRFPAYRVAIIATREAPSFNLQANLKALISAREEPSYPALWNVAALIVALSNSGILREKDVFLSEQGKQLSRLLDHANELERELSRRQDNADRLLDHLNNLEHSLTKERSHRSEIVQHTKNLEDSLRSEQNHHRQLLQHTTFLETDLRERQRHAANLERFLDNLRDNINGLLQHTQNLDQQSVSAQNHIANLDEHAKNLDRERKELVRHTNTMSEQNMGLGVQCQNLTDHIKNLEQDVQEQRRHAVNLQTQMQAQQDQIARLMDHIANLEENATQWKAHAQNLETILVSTQTHAGNLERLLTEKERHAQNLETVVAEERRQIDLLNRQSQELQTKNTIYQSIMSNIINYIRNAQESARPLRKLYRELDERLDLSTSPEIAASLKELLSAIHTHLENRDRLRDALDSFRAARSYKFLHHVGILPSLEEWTDK